MLKILINEPLILIQIEYGKSFQIQLNINTESRVCKGGIIIFIRENLIFLKKKSNMTWDEIAIRVGIPYRSLQDIIYKATNNPGIKNIILLAKYFNLTLDELVLKDLSK